MVLRCLNLLFFETKSETEEIRILNLNIRSLRNKVDALELLLHSLDYPEILCITETWLTEQEAEVIKICSYKLANSFCRKTISCGGVAIFIRENLFCQKRSFPKINLIEQMFEETTVDITFNRHKINISCLYRSPGANDNVFAESLEQLLLPLSNLNYPVFICGDFNYDFSTNEKMSVYVKNLFLSYGLIMCFDDFSRIQNNKKTLIDNVFASVPTTKLIRYC